jgi:hypothetical protein
MTLLSFRLLGVDDSSSTAEIDGNVLPKEWNKAGPDAYTLRYKHDQSSMIFLLKVVKLANRTVVHGIAVESDKTTTLDILTADYMSASFFPHDCAATQTSPLVHGFISSARVKDLMSLFKINILQKIVPGLSKEGYREESSSTNANMPQASSHDRPPPRDRSPPPLDPTNPYARPPSIPLARNPLSVGRSDLDPIPNPFSPPSLFGNDGDGMIVGPNHPMFRDRFQPGGIGPLPAGGPPGRRGPWGGDGYLPPMGTPPGARFDPIGPDPDMNPFGPGGRLPRAPRRQGDPSNDEFMPPGFGDSMFS